MSLRLEVTGVTKRYGRKPIFSPISFTAIDGEVIAITGSNGSGKSTLLKIIAGVLSASSGKVAWFNDDKKLDTEELSNRLGFVAPYLELYNELSAVEHVNFIGKLKNAEVADAASHLTRFGLDRSIASSQRLVGQYSSGMKQRVALAMSSVGAPDILLYDEPSSNLDQEGITALFDHITESSRNGKIVIIATNDAQERSLAHRSVDLQPYR